MKKFFLYLVVLILLTGCQKAPPPKSNSDWTTYRKAYDLLQKKPDSAFFYFNQVTVRSHDSLQIAMALSFMGQIQYRAGDYYGSEESHLNSLKYLRENNKTHHSYIAYNYNDLGLVRSELKDSDGALDFYEKTLKSDPDSDLVNQVWNNIAYEWQRKKAYNKAIPLYRRLLDRIRTKNTDYARALTNLAITKWLANPGFNASLPLREALAIRQHSGDLWGQNSSFAHLADFYHSSKPDSALFFARAMLHISKQIDSPDDQMEALGKLIDLSSPIIAKSYFNTFKKLSDSLQTVRNAAKNQFALIRYNVEKAQTDNLRLKQQNTDKEQEIFRQRLFLAIALAAVIFVFFWFRSRRQRLMLEADNRIRQDRLQLSQRVHDVVANGIYRVMNEVDYSEEIDKNYLVGQLDLMYEQSRKISQDEEPKLQEEFSEKLHELVNAFKKETIKLALSGNEPELWEAVNDKIKSQLELVLQELLVNMSKHSNASQAIIDFERHSGQLFISYRDNGVGFPTDMRKGKGLNNTENRIRAIGGELIFGAHDQPGARLQISIPVN